MELNERNCKELLRRRGWMKAWESSLYSTRPDESSLFHSLIKEIFPAQKRGNNPLSYPKSKTVSRFTDPIAVISSGEIERLEEESRRRRETISGRGSSLEARVARGGQSVSPCRRIDLFRVVAGLDRISSGIEVVSGRLIIAGESGVEGIQQ